MPTKQSLQFLKDLSNNNNRDWFQANQDRYEIYKEDYRNTVQDFIDNMSQLDEGLQHLEIKDCMFRINRDIRFTKDKAPYKNNMAIWMCEGKKNTNLAGYYVHIENGKSFIAGGVYWPDATDLKKIRREIDGFYDELEEIVANPEFKKVFGSMDRDENSTLKTSPKDFDKNHPAIEFLKLKCFTASAPLTDAEVISPDFAQKASQMLIVLKPLIDYLNRALTTE